MAFLSERLEYENSCNAQIGPDRIAYGGRGQ